MTKEAPIIAAGGIVLRGRKKPLIAVVQLRRQKIIWALPKGKLHKHETVLDAAKREALEETGRDVIVHEYLGQIAYKSSGMPKLAKFWRMEATGKPQKLMRDVRAVRWLPLNKAIALLTHRREQDFLRRAGPRALAAAASDATPDTNWLGSALNWLRARFRVPSS